MGTRNLTCIVKDGQYQVAKYCQWDGYPEGQGLKILKYLRSLNLDKLKENLKYVIPFNYDNYNKRLIEFGVPEEDLEKNFVGYETYQKIEEYLKLHPSISRDTGADILKLITETNKDIEIHNDLDFAADSLFCEWCYVIDFDKNTFEVYKGFNEEPLNESERFYFLQKEYGPKESSYSSDFYYPVKLIKSYQLNNLPTQKEFLEYFSKKDNEDV